MGVPQAGKESLLLRTDADQIIPLFLGGHYVVGKIPKKGNQVEPETASATWTKE